MQTHTLAIRPFIGSKDYTTSRNFYRDLGFEEVVLSPKLSLFQTPHIGFYLQDAYVKDWIDNTMVFVEVTQLEDFWNQISSLEALAKYPEARLVPIQTLDWGREFFVHDPSGVLWHFGEFR